MKKRAHLAVVALLAALPATASAAAVPAIVQQVGESAKRSGAFVQRLDFDSCETLACINRNGTRIVAFAAKEDALLRNQWQRSSKKVRATPCVAAIYRRSLQLTGTLSSVGKAFARLTEANSDTQLPQVQRRAAAYRSQATQLGQKVIDCGESQS